MHALLLVRLKHKRLLRFFPLLTKYLPQPNVLFAAKSIFARNMLSAYKPVFARSMLSACMSIFACNMLSVRKMFHRFLHEIPFL
jgi:hypothetical protein